MNRAEKRRQKKIAQKAAVKNPEILNQKLMQDAVVHHGAGRLVDAEVLYQKVLKNNPKHAAALNMVGVIAYQGGHFEDAILQIQNSIDQQPNFADAYGNLGLVLAAVNRDLEAIERFQKAISLKPDYTAAHFNLGNVFLGMKNLEQAEKSFQNVVSLVPSHIDAYAKLGDVYVQSNQFEKALACFQWVVQRQPQNALIWVRYECGLSSTAPIHNLRAVAESGLNVFVFLSHEHGSPLSGASWNSSAAGACVLIRHGMREHMRFTLAHEIAHLFAHPGQAHGSGKALPHDAIRSQETYANQFAAELLMPADGVRKMVGGESELESHRTIQRLAWYFQVSFQAIAIRLESMRFLKRGWYDHELERMKADGRLPQVPVNEEDLQLRPAASDCGRSEPQPALFKYYATMLLDEGDISLGKFCQLMGKDWDLDRADRYLHRFRIAQVSGEQE